jgi:transposase
LSWKGFEKKYLFQISVEESALYYSWLKDFMEAGKARLKGDSLRDATSNEVKELRAENARLKELVGEQALQLQLLKKSLTQ